MWPITPQEARILAGLTQVELYRLVRRVRTPETAAAIALTDEGAKVYYLRRGDGWGYGLGSYAHDGSDARRALERLHRTLTSHDRLHLRT